MLEARSLTKYYNHTAAVRNVSFSVMPGEILGYLGPNGAGKSTTVKMLTGLIEPSEGQRRVSGYLQGCLVAVMLGLLVLSFSVQARITNMLLQPEWARWLPPVWFLGLYQSLSGDPDPAMRLLANRAEAALAIAVVLTLLTYLISYRRHQALLVEGITGRAKDSRFGNKLHWLLPNSRQQAVVSFMTQTLARSSYHRMIVIGYAGLAIALILTGFAGMGDLVGRFLYLHMIVLLFLLIGARHLFSLPTELKANWIFQITEREGRGAWLHAVDRFVLFWGAALLLVIPLPLEVRLLGWRGVAEASLFLLLGLLTYEWTFSAWEKLPFTCSHLPDKTPIWMIMAVFGLIGGMAVLHSLLLATLYNNLAFAAVCGGLLAAWMRVHHTRQQGWAALPLKYDELAEPAVQELRLLR
jgi:energy-coupling factor transporter ATP-binding protein EcfA2